MEITNEQTAEIRNYLMSKKLQQDLLVEVEDHFVSQISQFIDNKNICFQEAFLETKILWTGELRMVRADLFSFKKIAAFEKKIVDRRFNLIILKSAAIAICLMPMNIILPGSGVISQLSLLAMVLMILGVSLIKKRIKFSQFLFLNFHPLMLKIFLFSFTLPYLFSPLLMKFFTRAEVSFYFSNFNILGIMALLVQIQLLYFNYNNRKVLL